MNATEALDELIAELEHSIEVDTIRLDLARQLRATYAAGDIIAKLAEPEPPKAPAKPKAKKRKAPKPTPVADETHTCEQCGETRPSKRSLGQHRRHCTGATPPAAAPTPKPHISAIASLAEPIEATRHFVCTTCDAKAGTREALAKHTDAQHHRGLKGEEHFAKAVAS